MVTLFEPTISPPRTCPYLPDRLMQLEYFYANEVDEDELGQLLADGWRTFGLYYFRPACPSCRECVPLRVRASELMLSRSQRRIRTRNRHTVVRIGPPRFREELFAVFREHNTFKFGQESDRNDFIMSFFAHSSPSLQSEYFVDGELAGVGFVGRAGNALSSVYFAYRQRYRQLGLGVFSVWYECRYAVSLGLPYYYLGYYISDNRSMSYKARFEPHERLCWPEGRWWVPPGRMNTKGETDG